MLSPAVGKMVRTIVQGSFGTTPLDLLKLTMGQLLMVYGQVQEMSFGEAVEKAKETKARKRKQERWERIFKRRNQA